MARNELAPDVRKLFEELVELDWQTRRMRLQPVRQDDAELALRVEELLRASDQAPDFLEQPARASELVGHRAGPWVIEAHLSSGGGGDVYRARRAEGPENWYVALKVLHQRVDGPRVLERFEAERRALAALGPPFVVPLIDAGLLEDGRPFLVTYLVEGKPLDEACVELGLEARLRLFLRVCHAVQQAHESMIAHGDLKPANILVGRFQNPQLIDFGIARRFAEEDGATALTPGYASLEQLAGQPLGAATDVWSLGVVLYELVSGRRPFAGPPCAPLRPASAAVLAPDAPRASCPAPGPPAELARRLRGDLDALLARALALVPGERYPTVEALARDLEAYLAGRPLAARPARAHRVRLWLRRHRAASALVAASVLALVALLWTLWREAERNRAEAGLGWRAHAQAVLATRWIEDLARHAATGAEFVRALDEARASLAREAELPPEAEGRLRITLGALYLEAGRAREARVELERARTLAGTTRGFGREDEERIAALLARAEALTDPQAQGSQPARSKNQ